MEHRGAEVSSHAQGKMISQIPDALQPYVAKVGLQLQNQITIEICFGAIGTDLNERFVTTAISQSGLSANKRLAVALNGFSIDSPKPRRSRLTLSSRCIQQARRSTELALLRTRTDGQGFGGLSAFSLAWQRRNEIMLILSLTYYGCTMTPRSRRTMDSSPAQQSSRVKIRVLIVDDHEILRLGVIHTLSADERFLVCGEAPMLQQRCVCFKAKPRALLSWT